MSDAISNIDLIFQAGQFNYLAKTIARMQEHGNYNNCIFKMKGDLILEGAEMIPIFEDNLDRIRLFLPDQLEDLCKAMKECQDAAEIVRNRRSCCYLQEQIVKGSKNCCCSRKDQ